MAFLEAEIKRGVRALLGTPPKAGRLQAGSGICRLAINRRLRVETEEAGVKHAHMAMRPNPDAPTDPQLGLLRVVGRDEEILLLNYACHPTTRGGFIISGDYPAAAMRELRADGSGRREVMFLQGGCGDLRVPCMNPEKNAFRGGDATDVIAYGNVIAGAARKILARGLHTLAPAFRAARTEFILPYDFNAAPPTAAEATLAYRRLVAGRLKHENADGVPLEWVAWELAPECRLLALPGEVCHAIARKSKRLAGGAYPFFLGYANGCPTYIPTDTIISEGGYEGRGCMIGYGQPYPFRPGSEAVIYEQLRAILQ